VEWNHAQFYTNPGWVPCAYSPDAFHALTALQHVTCGWTLFKELVWTCSPHMNGSFKDYRQNIRARLPVSSESTALYFQRIQDLSREIDLSHNVSGMQHELLYHCFHILSQNGDSGLTHTVLLSRVLSIKQARRSPSHPLTPLPFTYHEVITCLHDAEITHYN
jgi:hypothetical protein